MEPPLLASAVWFVLSGEISRPGLAIASGYGTRKKRKIALENKIVSRSRRKAERLALLFRNASCRINHSYERAFESDLAQKKANQL